MTSPGSTAADDDEARIADLVTASHILVQQGILDGYGHVTVRSSRNPARFYMPRAMPPGLISRADIVELDLDCEPVEAGAPRLNGERYIHGEIYRARPEVQSVIHAHDLAVIPFGIANVPLRPVVAQAGFLPPETPLFEIRDAHGEAKKRGMLVTDARLAAVLARKLGEHPVVLMRGHGETVVGGSVKEATVRAVYTNVNARAQAAAMALAPAITTLDDAELAFNASENFDADRPWNFLKSRLASRPDEPDGKR